MKDETILRHESYGMLRICRYHGGEQSFFGSAIPHEGGISLEILEGEWKRGLNSDWYMPKKRLIEIRMTENQFAEAITNLNASPVPVTLQSVMGEKRETPPLVNKRNQFENELDEQMTEVANRLASLSKNAENLLQGKKNLSKDDREAILKELQAVQTELRNNLPFIKTCFREAMDDIVLESKTEAENFIKQRAQSLGIDVSKRLESSSYLAIDTTFKETK